jgi:hypothetical protein
MLPVTYSYLLSIQLQPTMHILLALPDDNNFRPIPLLPANGHFFGLGLIPLGLLEPFFRRRSTSVSLFDKGYDYSSNNKEESRFAPMKITIISKTCQKIYINNYVIGLITNNISIFTYCIIAATIYTGYAAMIFASFISFLRISFIISAA